MLECADSGTSWQPTGRTPVCIQGLRMAGLDRSDWDNTDHESPRSSTARIIQRKGKALMTL